MMISSIPTYVYIIIGVIGLVVVWWWFRRRGDPLPERDPSCIWYAKVKKIDRVYDGDTFYAYIKNHNPIDKKPVAIRIRGIDTPEMTDSREAVRKKAEKAKAMTEQMLKSARTIHLYNVSTADKYGRILATVFCDRRDLAKALREKRLAKSYDGGTKKEW